VKLTLLIIGPLTVYKSGGYYMYHQFHDDSTFCQQDVFVCFVWISEQTVIISLYSIN
jgi:hypothetical protein